MRGAPLNRAGGLDVSPLALAGAGAAIVLIALATVTKADSDLWGHLRFGLDTLATRSLPSEDPYSFTQDRPWINHEWLSELMMGAAYTVAGVSGLAALKVLLVASALAMVWLALGSVRTDIRIVVMGAVAMGTVPVTRTLRPQLWTMVCLAVLCTALMAENRAWRRCLPLVFVVWANSHGGWIVGLGVLAAWTFFDIVAERRIRAEAVMIAVGSLVATLVTPYGWTLWQFIATTVSLSGRAITEWQPLWRSPPADAGPWVAAVLAGLFLARRGTPHRLQILGVLAVLAYASLKVVRIVPLFVFCSGMLLPELLAARWPQRAKTTTRAAPGEWPLAVGLAIASIAGAGWILSSSLRCVAVEGDWIPDAGAARRLQGAVPGRLVTFFDWGQYAIWHLSPTLEVSMDGRRETVYSDARLDEHGAILNGTPDGLRTLERWSPEYVWLPATSTVTRAWLLSRGYRLEYETGKSFVAVRHDLPVLPEPPANRSHELGCFPG